MPAAARVMLLAIALIVAVVGLSLLKVIFQLVPGPVQRIRSAGT
jgi:hypothetical protein